LRKYSGKLFHPETGRWQFSSGIGGNFPPEWVAVFTGISGNFEPEYVQTTMLSEIRRVRISATTQHVILYELKLKPGFFK